MPRRKTNIPHDFNNVNPIITSNDIISGFVFICTIVSVILMCIMFFIRNKPKEVLDTNVREESIHH